VQDSVVSAETYHSRGAMLPVPVYDLHMHSSHKPEYLPARDGNFKMRRAFKIAEDE
jgi:hypothetical protein